MKMLRSLLASFLTAALVHGSVAPAAAAAFETLKPIEISVQSPVLAPVTPMTAIAPIAPGLPANINVAETIGAAQTKIPFPPPGRSAQAQAAQPAALATLNVVTGQLAKAPAGDAVSADAVISRAIEGSRLPAASAAAPVEGASSASEGRFLAPYSPSASRTAPNSGVRATAKWNGQTGAVNKGLLIVLAVVAAVAITVGAIWQHSQKKNETWQGSKSNQEIVLIEKARRAGDADSLYTIAHDARARQARMNERIAAANSAGEKKVDDKTRDNLKTAKFYSAADGVVAERAEINHNAVSQDPGKRIGEQTPSTWKARLAGLDARAKATGSEGELALALRGLRAELGREDAKDQALGADIATFHKEVPSAFKGRLGQMEEKASADLKEFEATEVQPEHALYDQYNQAMRARVSAKLAAGSVEYQGHLAHLDRLSDADEQLKPALEIAVQIDKDIQEMAQHEHARQFDLLLASQNENVEVADYDSNGKQIGSHYEDHSGMYKALAATEGSEARASAASAQGGVKALHTILPLLRKNKTLQDEGLSSLLPADPRSVQGSGSVFFDFWIPASWNLFGSLFTESQASQARANFAPILAQLQGAEQLIGERRGAENGWVNAAIDRDLDAQVKQVPAANP